MAGNNPQGQVQFSQQTIIAMSTMLMWLIYRLCHFHSPICHFISESKIPDRVQ